MGDKTQAKLAKVRSGEWRIVHSQRARKLRRKGVRVWFDTDLDALVWATNPELGRRYRSNSSEALFEEMSRELMHALCRSARGFSYRGYAIPDEVADEINGYIRYRRQPLNEALLSVLTGSCGMADFLDGREAQGDVNAIGQFLYEHASTSMWGSRSAYTHWLEVGNGYD